MVHVTVRDHNVLEGDERSRRAPGVEREPQLGEQEERGLPGPRPACQAQFPPRGVEA